MTTLTETSDSLPEREAARIALRLALLANDARPFGVQKLSSTGGYPIWIGNYRILYDVSDKHHLVSIYRIKHRREAYRRGRH